MLKSMTFEVVGEQKLHCDGCENRVTRMLKGVQGIVRVRARASNQHVEVQFDPGVLDEAGIAARLAQAGYDTRIASPTQGQPT